MAVGHTTKLNLDLPDDSEAGDVAVINGNMEKIDEAMPIVVYSETEPVAPVEGTIWLKPIT